MIPTVKDDSQHDEIQSQLVNILYDNAAVTGIISIVFTLMLAGILWPTFPNVMLLAWTGAMLTITVVTYGLAVFYHRRPAGISHSRRKQLFVVTAVLTSIGWGMASVSWFPADSIIHQVFITVVLGGVSIVTIPPLSVIPSAIITFLLLTLSPLFVQLLRAGEQIHIAMCVMVTVLVLSMLKLGRKNYLFIIKSLEFRLANERLIGDLTKAKHSAELVNTRLQSEIVERRQAEEQLLAAKEAAESAAKVKSEFLATMSHEIRTPMNGVLGMTELLLHTELGKKQKRFAKMIQKSGEALLGIINDILDFSKIEAGKLRLQATMLDARQLLEELGEMFAEAAHRNNIELVCNYPMDAHTSFRADRARIRQILVNLIGNALKFTKAGEVIVRVTLQDETADKATLRFDVADTGIGIAPEVRGCIFESFSQADGSTTRRYGGTGLGLAICKRLVNLMGGEIGVQSELGTGSTFWFSIEVQKEMSGRAAGGARGLLDGKRVLIAVPNEANRALLRQQLRGWNMDCTAVESAQDAMRMLESHAGAAFDLLIFDGQTEGVDGIELPKRLRARYKSNNLKLVMLISVAQLEDTGQWLLAGIDGYLNKPVRQKELLDCLTQMLGGGQIEHAELEIREQNVGQIRLDAHVLVAEDNPVNQELAKQMLEFLGCRADIVSNGREVVAAITENPLDLMHDPYDLILMDCQMPDMDGFEATRTLRRWEQRAAGSPRIPVIALTANAMEGDREKCLAAGMNDYLSKPFDQAKLRAVLRRWLPLSKNLSNAAPALPDNTEDQAAPDDDPSAVETPQARLNAAALQRLESLRQPGAPDMVSKVIQIFLQSSLKLVQQIEEAIAEGDADKLSRAAHCLKSSSASVGADALADKCRELEALARNDRVQDTVTQLSLIEFEYEAACGALKSEMHKRAA